MIGFRIAGVLVALSHAAFLLFVMAGGLLVPRWPWVAWLHLPAAFYGAAVMLVSFPCPLTPLENWCRRRGGVPSYSTGFLVHYFGGVLCPGGLTVHRRLAISAAVVVVNVLVYGALLTDAAA